ncbi:MAG: UDP-N-acetylmuramoyl-L-alanyl-D-glutamate--2,6-diaminopimelate ligase [Acidobacteriaceae bacterium]|nr:UDP-N-acetylmuramoyl-L-alanyl-D-glutamate--2,6-diaminopimelate ligase [Acidobacteriaceae bacterium]
MQLRRVLEGVPLVSEAPADLLAREVRGLAYDSRKVEQDYLFFAFAGTKADGAQFANSALAKGALAVASERPCPAEFREAWLQVPHGRQALAIGSRNFFERPDERIALTAVTGTNGKTTSTQLIDAILRAAGKTTALIGTIEYHLAGRVLPAVNTTPESLDLFRMFHELEQVGGTYATLEASSHALDLGRIYAMQFHTAAFTNFTRDHLDYHQTMEAYFAAKQLLFRPRSGPPPRFVVLNADDEWARRIELSPETTVLWYGMNADASVRAVDVESSFNGLRFAVAHAGGRFTVESPLVGHINVSNVLLACGTALSLGIGEREIQRGIRELRNVPGRFERIEEGQPFMVVVDYAHTDDALRNVISVARAIKPERVITLFGCGGDRDRSKRPLMGMAAAELSDYVVLTSDNPRSEDPLAIINDAMVGLRRYDTPHVVEPDRERAIQMAIQEAGRGDIVILAGKGHETYQILRDGPIPFDDREVARRVLRSAGYARVNRKG